MQTPAALRRASEEDVGAVASALTEGFIDDPVYRAVFRSPMREGEMLSVFTFLVQHAFIPAGTAYLVGDCVAVLSPPDVAKWPAQRSQRYLEMLRAHVSANDSARLSAMAAVLQEAKPSHLHWHLELIATRRRTRGQGYGSMMMNALLNQVDREDGGVLVEATSQRSIPLYTRFGFRTVRDVDVCSGLLVTQMWRPRRDCGALTGSPR